MKSLALIAAVALAGCATPVPPPAELTNVQLCEAFFYAGEPYASQAGQEATNRGVRCPEYRDAVAQYRQGREAARAEVAREVILSRPLIPPMTYTSPYPAGPQRTVCTTQRIGNELQTICN